jgi:hypothetical protein
MPLEGHWRKSKENRHKLEVETGVRLIPLFIFNEQHLINASADFLAGHRFAKKPYARL